MIWDVDPVLFSFGPLTIKWYGLLFATGFMLGTIIMTRIYRAEGKPEQEVNALLMYMMVATVVGARLGHCLLYEPEYYLSNPLQILFVWRGGLASHGGALGIMGCGSSRENAPRSRCCGFSIAFPYPQRWPVA